MKFTSLQAVLGSAMVLASIPECGASSAHRRLHLHPNKKLHSHHNKPSAHPDRQLAKRGQCAFPTDEADLVAVTPGAQNAGWAMSPDQPCKPGNYCPYACKPGMVMAQWDPDSTYTYPASMNGGLFCDKSGNMQKPFPDKPLCVEGTGSVKAVNKAGSGMSWCQTVLPGNEAMLIPTDVTSIATLAVPDITYWQSTAAHFYVNPPGTDATDCVWGDSSKPVGNWSPYVAGANTDGSGNTFVKIGMNPIWESSDLASSKPSFGIKIECDGCQGLPCEIKPGAAAVSGGGTTGAGGAAFCVVTVPKGGSANIVAYGGGGDSDSDSGSGSSSDSGSSSTSASASATATASATASEPTHTTSKGMAAAAFAERPEKTSSAPPTSTTSLESSTTSAPSSTSSSTKSKTTSKAKKTTSAPASSLASSTETTTASDSSTDKSSATKSHTTMWTETSSDSPARPTVRPGIFHENSTHATSGVPSKSQPVVAPTLTHKAEAVRHSGGGAFAGLIVAFIATACLF